MAPSEIYDLKQTHGEVRVALRLRPLLVWWELRRHGWPGTAVFLLWTRMRLGEQAYDLALQAYIQDEIDQENARLLATLQKQLTDMRVAYNQAEQARINSEVRHIIDWEDCFE